jgi:hypothetical protein
VHFHLVGVFAGLLSLVSQRNVVDESRENFLVGFVFHVFSAHLGKGSAEQLQEGEQLFTEVGNVAFEGHADTAGPFLVEDVDVVDGLEYGLKVFEELQIKRPELGEDFEILEDVGRLVVQYFEYCLLGESLLDLTEFRLSLKFFIFHNLIIVIAPEADILFIEEQELVR